MIVMKQKFFLLFLLVLTAAGCDSMDEYSRHPCYVVIDNNRADATLSSAMNPLSPGVFCMITETIKGGAKFFSFQNNQGLSSSIPKTAVDERVTCIMGMNNGIIVGYGNLDYPAMFYAYDKECPNCFDFNGIPVRSRPLRMDSKGWAICDRCKRVYDLNNRGFVVDGEQGQPLTRYRASSSGPNGILSVR